MSEQDNMEPIPSILAWPGSGAPVQGAGGQTPVAGQELATGFANELDSLAALLDFAGEKEATPDGQNATATQLDLIAALVSQSLPQQFAVVAPTADGKAVPATQPVAVPTVTSAPPSLAATAQVAVLHDLSQIVDPGAFAQMQFSLPSPATKDEAAPTKQVPASVPSTEPAFAVSPAAPAVATFESVPLAMVGSSEPVVKAETATAEKPTAEKPYVVQAISVDVPAPSVAVSAAPPVAQTRIAEPPTPTVATVAPTPRKQVVADGTPTTVSQPTAQSGAVPAQHGKAMAPSVHGSETTVAAPTQKADAPVVAPAPIQNPSVQASVSQASAPAAADQSPPAASFVPEGALVASAAVPTTKGASQADEPEPVVGTEKRTVMAVAEKAAVTIKSGLGKDVFKETEDDPVATDQPKAESQPEPQTAHVGVRDVKVEVADTVKDKVQVVRHVREAVADTIRDLVEAKRPGQMVLRLQPEDLGTVTVTVKTLGPKVDAEVTASDPQLRSQLAQHRHDLVASVERRGLQMGEFTVGHEQTAWDASQNAGHRQQQNQPMRNDFEQASRLAGQPVTSQLAVATYAVSATDSVDYVV